MRHSIMGLAVGVATVMAPLGLVAAQNRPRQSGPQNVDASTRMNQLGPENGRSAARAGTWTVTETVWDTPGSAPKVTRGQVAERRMVGAMLQETLLDHNDAKEEIVRMDYLSFNRVEGRWEYVSMDTRAPVGIMTAQSHGRGDVERDGERIEVVFQPFAVAGAGQAVSGQMLRMRQDIITLSADRDIKNQYFTLADGTGTEWLAHRYEYARK